MKHSLFLFLALSLLASGLPAPQSSGEEASAQSIRGAVITSSGQPAGSVWVVLERDGQERGRALTADDGRYYVSRLPPGPYVILVRRGEATLYRAQVRLPGDAVHDIVLR